MNSKKLFALIAGGGALGLMASFLQLLEKITLLKNPNASLTCNLNSVFSCGNVLNAHQSSVFGFPNSMMCLIFFTAMLAIGLAGWSGSRIHKNLRFFLQAFALFFAGFGFWYLWQSIFNIGSICLYCLFCYGGLLVINFVWLRLNYPDYPLKPKAKAWMKRWIAKGADIFLWLLVAAAITLEAIIKFA